MEMTEVPKFLLERWNDLSASVSEQETAGTFKSAITVHLA